MYKKFGNYLKARYLLIAIVIIVAVISGFTFFGGGGGPSETYIVKEGEIKEVVDVTGNVSPHQRADLGFEKAGIVSVINVKVGDKIKKGDILASLDNSDTNASLYGALASHEAEQARLAELERGLRTEEAVVEKAKLESVQSDYEDALSALFTGLYDAYIKTENSLVNYADTFFDHGQSVVPRINITVSSQTKEKQINSLRATVNKNMEEWKELLDQASTSSQTEQETAIKNVRQYLEDTKIFYSMLSDIVRELGNTISGLTQDEINEYISTLNTAVSTFNQGVESAISAEANYRTAVADLSVAEDEYALKQAGSSSEALQAQKAKVSQASASILSYQVELNKKTIIAPFDGIVSKAEPEVGEFVQAGNSVFGMINDETYKVEINVPEVDVAKIRVGNPAMIQLDAYGDDVTWKGHVSNIDPAETIVEGVPTYKVTVEFDSKDERIRSGMTADVEITTQSKSNVLVVPFRAVINKDGKQYVRLVKNGVEFEEIPVVVGARGSDGMVEIVSGLNVGSVLVTEL